MTTVPLAVPVAAPAAASAPVPYHRLAVNERLRWWRAPLGTLLLVLAVVAGQLVLYVVAWVGAAIAGQPLAADQLPVLPDAVETAVLLAGIALALPVVLVIARLVQGRPAGTLSSVTGRPRWGWLGRCALLMVPAMAVLVVGSIGLLMLTESDVGSAAGEGYWPGLGTFLAGAGMLVVLVPLQAAAEEYVFRGWLLQAIGAYVRSPWPAIVLTAILFSLSHGVGTAWGFADLIVFGVVAGWLTVRTGGLEAAVALHAVSNLTWLLLAAATGPLSIQETAADMPWQTVLVDVVVLGAYAAAVLWLARRRGLITKAATNAPSAPNPA